MHCEPLAEQRAQMGCCLLHLTLEAAQASHEARSLGLRSCCALVVSLVEDLGAEVGEGMGDVEVGPRVKPRPMTGVEVVADIVVVVVVVMMEINGRVGRRSDLLWSGSGLLVEREDELVWARCLYVLIGSFQWALQPRLTLPDLTLQVLGLCCSPHLTAMMICKSEARLLGW